MSNGKDIIVELPSGERYGVADEKTAAKRFPEGKIVGYQDGQPWDGETARPAKATTKKASTKRNRSAKPIRAQLNRTAADKGVANPEALPSIDAVKAAIRDVDSGAAADEAVA